MITLFIAGILGIAVGVALLIAAHAQSRLAALEQRLAAIERGELAPAAPLPSALARVAPLQGLRVALDITQDHPHPIFANLLREELLKADVLEVTSLPETQDADLLITGTLTCNGYAEVYFQANLTAYAGTDPVCTIAEAPPGGDRPANLAIELVSRLGIELEKRIARSERRQALRELRLD